MRNSRQVVLLALFMAFLLVPSCLPRVARASRVNPAARVMVQKRVLLVGDSLSIGLGKALDTAFAGQSGIRFSHLGKVSSGLATPSFFDWDAHLTAQVKAHHPDIVLIMLGANDDKSLSTGAQHLAFGSKGWEQAYAARLVRLHTIIRNDNPTARIFFVGVPVMADPGLDAATVRINAVLAETARRLPGSRFIHTRDVLADASGGFASRGQGADGRVVRLRARDGVHISGTGSRLLAARCVRAVAADVGVAAPRLLASLDSLDVQPMESSRGASPTVRVAKARRSTPKPAAVQKTAAPVVAARAVKPAAVAMVTKPASAVGSYAVAEGDTLWSVAKRLGFDVAALQRANWAADPQRLQLGQRLLLPASDRPVATSAIAAASDQDAAVRKSVAASGLYPVAKGDTLWGLSHRFGVSLDTMLAANTDIDPSHLRVGQLVTIPEGGHAVASAGNMLFPIASGDTLWGIARRFGVTVEALVSANPGIDPLRLQAGQTVHVPSSLAAVAAPSQHAKPAAPVASEDAVRVYSVQAGDTLWDLARHYDVSVEAILRENAGIDPVRLRVGQLVRLPGSVVSMAAR